MTARAAGKRQPADARPSPLGRRRRTAHRTRGPPSRSRPASERSSRLTTEATARPTRAPVRCTTSAGARRPPARDGSDGRPRRLGLQTAPRAARARTTVGHHHHVPDVAGVAETAVEQPAVEHDAAAHPGRDHHGEIVADAARPRRPSPRPEPAPWRRCRRTWAARCTRPSGHAAGSRAKRGCSAATPPHPRGSLARHNRRHTTIESVVRRSVHRPGRPPERPGRPRATRPGRRCWTPTRGAPCQGAVVGTSALDMTAPSPATTPAAILVPPMSTARTEIAQLSRRWKRERNQSRASLTAPSMPFGPRLGRLAVLRRG